jgi:hypothetical protein
MAWPGDRDPSQLERELRDTAALAFSHWYSGATLSKEEVQRHFHALEPHLGDQQDAIAAYEASRPHRPVPGVILVDLSDLAAAAREWRAPNGGNGLDFLCDQIAYWAGHSRAKYTGPAPGTVILESARHLSALRKACRNPAVGIVIITGQTAQDDVSASAVLRAIQQLSALRVRPGRPAGTSQGGSRHLRQAPWSQHQRAQGNQPQPASAGTSRGSGRTKSRGLAR